MDSDSNDSNKKTSSKNNTDWMSIIAIGIALIALIIGILAFFLGKGSQGTIGATGATGPQGPMITGQTEAIYDTNKNVFVLPPIYNGYNIVIPPITPPEQSPSFSLDASDVKNGDVFTIDNTNNPNLFFYIQVSGFDNIISESTEIVLNSGTMNNGRNNTALVNITTGKTDTTTNLFIFINSY